MSTVYTYDVSGIRWNYTRIGTFPNEVASIGTGTNTDGNATTFLGIGITGAIEIPSLLDGYHVRIIGQKAFSNCTRLTSIKIPDSVTTISVNAFYFCTGLTSLLFGNSVTTIGAAFENCIKLSSINIPDSVTSINSNAFLYCGGLTTVTIGNSVKSIGGQAFRGCTNLTSINIPDSVTSIDNNAFFETSVNLVITISASKAVYFGKTSPNLNQSFFGNTSVDFALPPPSMTITSTTSGVTSGSTTNNSTIALRFTASASTSDFVVTDISLNNGSLNSSFAGSGTVYNAIFTPNGQGLCTINVPANRFTAAGQNNIASNTFTWTYDSISPTMDISSTTLGVTRGSTTKTTPIELRFTSNEATNNFGEGDISFNNGTLSNFATISPTVYTATFTPTGPGPVACTIDVLAGAYTDAATNLNNLATQFAFTYDSVPPNMDITANVANNATTNNATIELTFTSSKPTTNFIKDDITVNNGTLSTPLTYISDMVYKATFTPTGQGTYTINVAADKFTDAVGNGNAASNTFNWTYDSDSPNMTIASTSGVASGSTTNVTPIELRFTSTEATNNFGEGGISVTNGTLSNFASSSPTVYTARFTPTGPGPVACTIDVLAGAYTDAATNLNNLATQYTFTFDSVRPEMTITSTNVANNATTNNATIDLTFTSTESTTNFVKENIRVTNGELSPLTTSDNMVYNATFTRINTITEGQCTIDVDAGAYTDAAGNNNNAATTFIWNFETVSPNMTITATAGPGNVALATGATTNHTSILLTFTANEVPTGFEYADISFNGGTLSPLTGSGMVYSATFTPDENDASGKTECSISVPADKFTDDVGNYNTASNTFNFTFDNTKPGMIITATASGSNLATGATTNHTSILLTFTSTEVPNGFEYADISFNGGTLSPLTGSDTVYSATFTPDENDASGKTECSISVPADKFTDAVGNYNTASNTFNFTFDNTKPGMIITATASGSALASGSTTKNAPIALTFTSPEPITGFEYADINVTGGTLSALTGSGTDYTATFTPDQNGATGKTECSISVPEDKFTDAAGNSNFASNTFNFTFDNTKPGMIITATASGSALVSGSTTKNRPIALTFTSPEPITGFEYADISVSGGTLSALTGSGTDYTATFTPDANDVSGKTECSISVPADKFTDDVGNYNTASNTFTFTFDNTKPSMTITATASGSALASGSTTKNTPLLLTFTSAEAITGFEYADISVTGGTLSAVTGSGTVYTATFTPDANDVSGKTECSISVPADKFTDDVGNFNTVSNTFNFTFDNTKPDMIITATASGSALATGATTNHTSILLTFTATEAITGFDYADISFNGGTLSPLTGSDTVYTATFTPNQIGVSGKTECSISVPADKFTDAVGNSNTASNTFNFTFDNTKPDMIITATSSGSVVTSGSTTKNTPIELTFTATESITDFEYADISFTGGTLSPLDGSGTVYTATFTPNQNGASGKTECSIVVPADKFTDAVGNSNTASNTFNFTFDNTKPGMIITATASGSVLATGSTTKNTPIELTFTASEVPTGFEYADISVTGGTLSAVNGSGTVYSATFTPDENDASGKTECSIVVPADKFTDAVGNYNTSTTFNFTFDNTKPGMIITATASGSVLATDSTTKNTPIELTFTASEAITGFDYADISFNGGTLSAVNGSGSVYSATFTPDQNGVSGKTECSISVPADKFTDGVGNNNNAAPTFNFTFDNTKPGMIITATVSGSNLVSGSTTKNTPIELTFTASEVSTDFEYADISFNGGTLSAVNGSGMVYSATFTPDQNGVSGKTECSIVVPEDKFTDAVGNYNTASNTFNFTFDNTKPGMIITATADGSAVTSGSTTKNTPIELTFTATEVSTDFEYADISFNGGTLSAVNGSGMVYSATFTPDENDASGKTECSISVPADKFTDDVGNYNTASNTFNFTFDNTKPGMIITATASGSNLVSGSTTTNTPIELTFTASEVSTDFEYADISFTGGTLSAVNGSGTVYSATFTPDENDASGKTECSISVPADKFTDAVGNYNTASNIFNFTFDNTKPGMIITATAGGSAITSGSTTKNTPIELTFTASEVPTDFEYADISFNGGTLSAVNGSGTVYSATFTPDQNDVSGKTECSIVVPADKFIDALGNYNTASNIFNFTFDNTKPGMMITATASGSAVTTGSTTKNTPIELTFTATESITNFDYADISFNGGTLSPLTGSDTVYSATFTPDQNGVSGKTECSVVVPADKFTDDVGNYNTASNTFNFTFDNTKPGMIITATASGSNLVSGSTTKNTPIELTFTASEVPTDFEYADISFNGGTLSAVNGSGTVYSATFTPDQNDVSGKTECSIVVPADKFTDAVGNYNTASNTFNFTFDNTKPGMIITATASGSNLVSGSTTKNTPIELTFTATEAITEFDYADISFNGGTLSAVNGSGSVYSATFTPDENDASGKTECSISVPADKFTDAVGNFNSASNTFNFTFDNTKPGMIITATAGGSNLATGSTTKNTPIALTFTSPEPITGFEYADISVSGGTLSAFNGSGTVYSATFTPDQNGVSGKTECSISVPADKFIDGVGNNNNAAPTFNFTFDNTKPGMIITATAGGSAVTTGSTTKNSSIQLTFTATESITGFEYADISFTGGTLSAVNGSGSVYSATFTPDQNDVSGKTECSISVPADKFTDDVGNNNNAAPTFNFTFDNTKPGMIITAAASGSNLASGSTTKNTPIELTFTATESITDFEYADISFTGGTLSAFNGSGTVYSATFTPDQNGVSGKTECSVVVPEDKFTDAVGNYNTASNIFNFTFDNTKPGMIITATASGSNLVSGSTTKNAPIELTFTASEVSTDFEYADISFTGGTLSPLAGGGSVYSATFTPDENDASGKTECSISVPADKFTDDVGNYNTASNIFNFTFDNTKPGMMITATASGLTFANNAITNNASIELTFTSSEPTNNFVDTNISVTNGQLTNFAGIGTDGALYTATFTRDPQFLQCQCTINVAEGAYTDAAGNSNIEATQFTWTFDSVPPDMTITSTTDGVSIGSTTNISPIALKFKSSKPTNNFVVENIIVTNGVLTNFAGNGTDGAEYTVTFTPTGQGLCTIDVAGGVYTDAAGNSNNAATTFTWTFDSVSPTMTITSTMIETGSITNNESIEFTFTSSEPTTNFVKESISLSNGTLSPLAGIGTDGTVYTAIFTPANQGLCTIGVASGAYTDAAGNSNNAATTFSFTFDSVPPTMIITSTTDGVTNGSITNNASIALTFTSSEPTNNFVKENITLTNGTLTNFAGTDGTVYNATFTPTFQGACTIDVAAGTYTDAAGNSNTASTTFNWSYEIVDYENVTLTPLSFVNDTLSILNRIDSTDVDRVSFDVNAGRLLYSLEVTSLFNTNAISYVLDISGGSTVSSGSFAQAGVNMLNGAFIKPAVDTTYILTLTCGGTNIYSIVGMLQEKFDIDKFCSKVGIPCNNVGYNRLVTTNNDPSISNKMRYSQLLRTRRFKQIQVPGLRAPPLNNPQPLYLFSTGQIFTRSAITNLTPNGHIGPVCPNR